MEEEVMDILKAIEEGLLYPEDALDNLINIIKEEE